MAKRSRPAKVALAIAIVGSLVAVAPASATTTGTGTYFGAYVQPEDWSKAGQIASVTSLEGYLGRTLDIDHLFYKWNAAFPGWRQSWDLQNGRIPMISWRGTYLSQVLNGSQDALIRDRANGLKALGGRVLLRWFAEMDAVIYERKEISSPSQFVSAWRYVHDIFASRGATNVEWVWCPNAYAFATGEAQQYYPGDAYVDWICADGYNWAPARPNSRWTPFKDIFASFYAWGAPKAAPLMVGETGVMENAPGDKAAWITDMGNTIKTTYPEIKALVYFDSYSTANFGGWYDWRVDTSTSSYNAFKALGADPYFNGSGTSTGAGSPEPPEGGGGSEVADSTPPTTPRGLQAVATAADRVDLSWMPSTDDVGVVAYDIVRDASMIASVSGTGYGDGAVSPLGTYSYTVQARDAAGNTSAPCRTLTVTTPSSATAFSDGFESGTLGAWTSASGMGVLSGDAHAGSWAARAQSTGGRSYAMRSLPTTDSELYARAWFKVVSQSTTVNLLRFQSSSGANVLTVFMTSAGELMLRNDVRASNLWSPTKPSRGAWHQVQVRVKVAGSSSLAEVWYDGQRVAELSKSLNLGTTPIGRLILGDNVSSRTYEVLFDDVAIGAGRL